MILHNRATDGDLKEGFANRRSLYSGLVSAVPPSGWASPPVNVLYWIHGQEDRVFNSVINT